MKNWKANMLAITVGVISVILFVLGIWWLLWKLWLFVVPQFWPAGPEALIHPDYWLFAAGWVLFGLIGRVLFKSESK